MVNSVDAIDPWTWKNGVPRYNISFLSFNHFHSTYFVASSNQTLIIYSLGQTTNKLFNKIGYFMVAHSRR